LWARLEPDLLSSSYTYDTHYLFALNNDIDVIKTLTRLPGAKKTN